MNNWLHSEFWVFCHIFFDLIDFQGWSEGPILFLAALDSNPWPPGCNYLSNTSIWTGLSNSLSENSSHPNLHYTTQNEFITLFVTTLVTTFKNLIIYLHLHVFKRPPFFKQPLMLTFLPKPPFNSFLLLTTVFLWEYAPFSWVIYNLRMVAS